MKIHYINILLFALPLNILVRNQRNHRKSILSTTKSELTKTHRTLCECELYAPSKYENDPEMKEVMENFDRQTSERFRKYDERIQDKRKQFKEQCEKDIQKIILKDKIEKQLSQQFSKLQTNIETNDIPTCICEKSVAEKVEKTCLKCGEILGTVVPELGLIGGTVIYASAQSAAVKVGVSKAIELMKDIYFLGQVPFFDLVAKITPSNFNDKMSLIGIVHDASYTVCETTNAQDTLTFCFSKYSIGRTNPSKFLSVTANQAKDAAEAAGEAATGTFSEMTSVGAIFSDALVISAIVVVIIAVIILIIYLILRYRRKKKMKKKLQYIKLLEE
ncbi:hypothetical protein PFAG_01212 [Plasmodium falciparum Santa Lucia]|uniref:Surface antigen n=1 Tax=Plasmodium falciparum Santa Lucia TaxID=478859 RepID=W7G2J4_PLAFA|nr:hypothetical protein PFAG_01212 [Plasmodium falciparum Santa Lucia]